MKQSVCILAVVAGSVIASEHKKLYVDPIHPCRKTSTAPKKVHVKSELAHVEALPENYIWNAVGGVNYLTNIRN
jgi:hypothetical protein